MGLTQNLDEIRADLAVLFSPAIQQTYDSFVEGLVVRDVKAGALRVGDRIPDFALPSADGRMVRSDGLLAEGPLVISFFRGDWCPYCVAELEALGAALPEIRAAGGRLVALTPDTVGIPARTARRLGLNYDVLCDVDFGVGAAFGIVFRVPEEVVAVFRSFGLDFPARHGTEGWMLPIPATFVVDRAGIVRAAHVDPDFTRRMDPDEVVAALRAIGREG